MLKSESSSIILIENTTKNFWIAMAFIAVAIFICYAHGFSNGFTWDGRQYILENNHLVPLNWANLKIIFTSYELGNYHPFTMLSYAIEAQFVGQKNPWLYHFDQAVLHLANSYLIFRILLKLNISFIVAFITAMLFAIHPLHVESVIWDGERKDTLYCLFLLISFDYYIEYWKQKENWRLLAWSVFFFICSCLSKGMAVILPVVLLLTDYFLLNRRLSLRLIWEKAPYWILAVIFGIVATKAQKIAGADASAAFNQIYTFTDRLFFATFGLAFYWKKMFWPTNLSAFYPYPVKPFTNDLFFTAVEVVLLLGALIWLGKKNKLINWGWLYFGVVILPVLQLLPIGSAIVAERYFYVSSIGPLLIVAILIDNYLLKNIASKKVKLALLGLIFLPLIFLSFQRVKIWKSDYYVFKNVIHQFPQNGFITGNVGWYFEAQAHKKDSAEVYFKKAIASGWETTEMINKLGEYTLDKKDYSNSAEYFKKGIAKDAKQANSYWMLATAYYYLDSLNLAEKNAKLAVSMDSMSFNAFNIKGLVDAKQNKYNSAILAFKRSIAIFGDYEDPYINLGDVYNTLKQTDKEIDILKNLIARKPKHKDLLGYKNLGAAFVSNGKYLNAIGIWKKAISIDTLNDNAFYFNIGLQYGLNNKNPEALFWMKQAAKKGNIDAQQILKEKGELW